MALAPFLSDTVEVGDAGLLLGEWLRRRRRVSLTLLRRLKQCGGLWINGWPAPVVARVEAGDRIELALPVVATVAPEPVPVHVVFEDAHLLVVDKPAGLVVHPSRGHPGGTLLNGIVNHRLARGEPPWAHPVNRLDRGTSGLMVIAKHPYAHQRLMASAVAPTAGRALGRTYVALVVGHLGVTGGVVALPIAEPVPPPEAQAARPPATPAEAVAGVARRRTDPQGRAAVTRYRVVVRGEWAGRPACLVCLMLRTGRTHQIRVHLAALGHSLFGDPLYGQADAVLEWPTLHARKLWLIHPVTGRRHTWRSPLPAWARPDDIGAGGLARRAGLR